MTQKRRYSSILGKDTNNRGLESSIFNENPQTKRKRQVSTRKWGKAK